jgi:tellurium resistance protein TerD
MEPLILVKGQKVDLTKSNPGLQKIAVGLSWDLQDGVTFDLDAFAIPVNAAGKMHSHILYFGSAKDAAGKPSLLGGALHHSGDNLTGAGDGDDEIITVDVSTLPADCDKVVFGINIYNAKAGQNFGQVKAAFARVFDATAPTESILKYDLNEDFSSKTAIIVGEIYRKDGEWKFSAIGEGKDGDLNTLAAAYN